MAEFIGELVALVVIVYVLWRYVRPRVSEIIRSQQETIQKQVDAAKVASERLAAAELKYREALAESRTEAAKIRDTARSEGQKILDDFRTRTNAEVAELRQQATEQLAGQREQVMAELEPRVRELAGGLASRVVGEDVATGKGGR